MKMEVSQNFLMRIIADHFRRYAHALRFAIGLHGAYKFNTIVKNKHYQISSGARASLDLYPLTTISSGAHALASRVVVNMSPFGNLRGIPRLMSHSQWMSENFQVVSAEF